MSKLFIVFLGLVATASAASLVELVRGEWHAFKAEYGKGYESETEERFRMKIFMDNKHKIEKHNQQYERGQVSFRLGLNEYADLLHDEFVRMYVYGFNKTVGVRQIGDPISYIEAANIVALPSSVDWREQGAVTGIKNQGGCGSCWAFSATGALEGQHFRKTGALVSLSEQNLVDCSSKYGNHGCNGGLMDYAFQYIKDNDGIDTESSYPYVGVVSSCRYSAQSKGASDRGYVDIPSGNEDQLKSALATVGPISVAIDASHESFQFYKNGVYYDPKCDSEKLNHGVLAIGYGTDQNGRDFYIVKNSWGTTWGDGGYIKMARNLKNHCGIATVASYPLV